VTTPTEAPSSAGAGRASGGPGRGPVRVFVSVDLEHDAKLYERLRAESTHGASGFDVRGCSDRLTDGELWSGRVREQIRAADLVIVICGEHTGSSPSVAAELRIAREEKTPHILLWGHREIMCTKPQGATPAEGMYSWTYEVLQERLAYVRRTGATAEALEDAARRRG